MAIDKELKALLQTTDFKQIKDPELIHHADKFRLQDYKDIPDSTIIHAMIEKLKSTKINNLSGYEPFKHQEVVIGVTQHIDNLVMKHGLENLQILEHDYKYHWRLNQHIKYAKLGNLKPNSHMILGMPFPGHCCKHNDMDQIISECNEKNISLHLDCAWINCAKDIEFNFDQECIKSFAMSFSKAYGLGWNRVGIRWSRQIDPTDSITIFNQHNMFNTSLIKIAYHYAKHFDIDYLWNKYEQAYKKICKDTLTMPTNTVWLGKDIRGNLVGMADALQSVSMSN
tara:strand:- start:871 stop:1719 length:849 start_codon:yes stop_codon:yes gene_type:complete